MSKLDIDNHFDLSGSFAIVTGGAGLLGKAHATALLALNCDVELWDVSSQALQMCKNELSQTYPDSSVQVRCIDITKEDAIVQASADLKKKRQVVDILINNAALNPKIDKDSLNQGRHFEEYSLESYESELAVGLTGAMLCAKHLGSMMAKQGKGVILNIASDLSVIAPDQRIYEISGVPPELQFKKPVSYSVIKAGLVGLTKYLATYWAESGVRVNALSPGGVLENQNPEFVNKVINLIPMGRMASKSEYIGAVQFLCSDASAYMTGQNIVMDGGRSVW